MKKKKRIDWHEQWICFLMALDTVAGYYAFSAAKLHYDAGNMGWAAFAAIVFAACTWHFLSMADSLYWHIARKKAFEQEYEDRE